MEASNWRRTAGTLCCALALAACGNGATTGGGDSGPRNDTGSAGEAAVTPDVGGPEASPPDAIETPDAQPIDAPADVTGSEPSPDVIDAAATTDALDVLDAVSVDAPAPMDAPEAAVDTGPLDAEVACNTGSMRCTEGGACLDLQIDVSNCGMCGRACPAGQACVAGNCGCATGQMLCGGTCVDAASNEMNCGMCGRVCAAGQVCVMGACDCPTGQTVCGTGTAATCATTASDAMNCGACGSACGAGQTCTAGACVCPAGQTRCGTGASSTCVNAQTDGMNCGACGTACTGGATCSMGACVCATGETRCGAGATAACVNTSTDSMNCGACGTACPSGQVCNGGTCQLSCTAPRTRCGTGTAMECANLQTDNQNCGACGALCGAAPEIAGASCVMGACRAVCNAGFADCNGTYADGCEVNTTSSAANCGGCGMACPASAANASAVVCTAGACRPTCVADTAAARFRDCNATTSDGCETNVLSTNAHCGACGNACGAGQTCVAGACTATSCAELHTRAPSLPSGVYVLDIDGAGSMTPFSAYCDMTHDGGGWTLVHKLSDGVDIPAAGGGWANDSNVIWNGGALNEGDATLLNLNRSAAHYQNRIVTLWNAGFTVTDVRASVVAGGAERAYVRFTGTGTDRTSWFQRGRVATDSGGAPLSSWTDLFSEGQNFFSIAGDPSYGRRWFINRNYGGCGIDFGWFIITSATRVCAWEGSDNSLTPPRTVMPGVLYATGSTGANWNDTGGAIARGDAWMVFVR